MAVVVPPAKRRFSYVYIPADVSEDIQQLELDVPEGKDVECLLEKLKEHFSGHGMTAQQKEAQKKALLEQLGENAGKVDAKMLALAADMQMVENTCLLANHRDVGYVGVNLYTDDHAQAKQLPLNPRASGLAQACGRPTAVRGDAFVARIFDNDDDFRRMDFTLAEVSSSAPWVVEAGRQVARRGQADLQGVLQQVKGVNGSGNGAIQQAAGGQRQQPQQAATAKPLSEAEQAKERGNAAVKRGDWSAAAEAYTRALELQPDLLAALSNRALAHLKLGQLDLAVTDCDQVLQREPGNVKTLLRRASALVGKGEAGRACEDYKQVLRLEPVNREAAAALDKLQPPPLPPDLDAATDEPTAAAS